LNRRQCAKLDVLSITINQEVSNMQVNLISIDLAKSVFQVCGVNRQGKSIFNRSVRRANLLKVLAQYPGVPIAMEACSGSNYWGREFQNRGHDVRLIPPIHVKPFVKGNKNDRNDAFAISEASRRPDMRFVPPRSLEQTDLILAHRIRERRVRQRTTLMNQTRGLLNEYGIAVNPGPAVLRQALPRLLEDAENGLTPIARRELSSLEQEWRHLDALIDEQERHIRQSAKDNPAAARLTAIKGVGDLIATAAVAKVGSGHQYRSGRQFSACLGLVPKEHSSGGRQKLGGITRRGNDYLRRLLVQGAWSVVRYADHSDDRLSRWARQLIARRGKHKAAVAVANKLARIIWSMLHHGTAYQAA
jgi:transposase